MADDIRWIRSYVLEEGGGSVWHRVHLPGHEPRGDQAHVRLRAGGHRYGLPPFWALHAWVFRDNPAGNVMAWNPHVSC